MGNLVSEVRKCIEEIMYKQFQKIIIYPYGDVGMIVKRNLNEIYEIQEAYIIDNQLSKYNSKFKSINIFDEIDCSEYAIIVASTNMEIYGELLQTVRKYFIEENIFELAGAKKTYEERLVHPTPKIGKYSAFYGKSDGGLLKEMGAFSGVSEGVEILACHDIDAISTHQMMFVGSPNVEREKVRQYDSYKEEVWYFPGVKPHGKCHKDSPCTIGNDVYIGRNALILNGANIGNGAIVGAGSVVTKDVPDYAIVAGVPARVIRYRYTADQIDALNKIKWWDWPDEIIRERYEDLYLPVDEFIEKYLHDDSGEKVDY